MSDTTSPKTTIKKERRRRHIAGEDPFKKAQILRGAAKVFSEKIFDQASIDDIASASGVSKSTVYVYFKSKVHLYEALIENLQGSFFNPVIAQLDTSIPLDTTLHRFGVQACRVLNSRTVIRVQRTLISTVDTMPEVSNRFYANVLDRAANMLREFLDYHVAAGNLNISDTRHAAYQFADLCNTSIYRRRLFGVYDTPPDDAEINKVVTSAVNMFLKAYCISKEAG